MSKHTPGPWRVMPAGEDDSGVTHNFDYVQLCRHRVCVTEGRSKSEANANARLIASAPDLLEALQHIMRCIGTGTATIHWDSSTWHQIDAAIAKATGENAE